MRHIITLLRRIIADDPRRIFLIDAAGAMVSALLLGVVLVRWQSVVGIPHQALYLLAAMPCCFVLYDLLSCVIAGDQWRRYLRGIAVVNMGYCVFSLGMAAYHADQVLVLGWIYIVIEIFIVGGLAFAEYQISLSR